MNDGHTVYEGKNGYSIQSDAKYPALTVSNQANIKKLQDDLKFHQKGGTTYLTFCEQAAEAGVEKWTVDMAKMTCTYYDKKATALLTEAIPRNC